MPELIIQELARNGGHIGFHRVEKLPLRIGRALDNDLVLADPYISPYHLTLEPDGQGWILVDQGSENGTFLGRNRKVDGPVNVASGDQLFLGRTVLKLLSPGQQVAPTLILPSRRTLGSRLLFPALALLSLVLTIGAVLLLQYLETPKKIPTMSLFAGVLPFLFIPLIWAGLWASAGFIVRRRARYSLQLVSINLAVVFFLVLSALVEYIDYFTGSVGTADAIQYAGLAVLASCLLFVNLTLAGGAPDLKRTLAAIVVGGGIVTAIVISDHAESADNRIAPLYSHTIKPHYVKVRNTRTLDQFIVESNGLFAADKSAGNKKEGKKPKSR